MYFRRGGKSYRYPFDLLSEEDKNYILEARQERENSKLVPIVQGQAQNVLGGDVRFVLDGKYILASISDPATPFGPYLMDLDGTTIRSYNPACAVVGISEDRTKMYGLTCAENTSELVEMDIVSGMYKTLMEFPGKLSIRIGVLEKPNFCVSPDMRFALVTESRNEENDVHSLIMVYDLQKKKLVNTLDLPGKFNAGTIQSSGEYAVLDGEYGSSLVNLKTGDSRGLNGVGLFAFTKDGKRIVFRTKNELVVYDIDKQEQVQARPDFFDGYRGITI